MIKVHQITSKVKYRELFFLACSCFDFFKQLQNGVLKCLIGFSILIQSCRE